MAAATTPFKYPTTGLERSRPQTQGIDIIPTSRTYANVLVNPITQDYIADNTPPSVNTIARVNTNPIAAASVDFTVTFSEPVTGVDVSDFSLTTTGANSAAVISGVSGSGTTYTVTVDTSSGDGTIRLDVGDDDSIVDATSNPLGGSGAGNGAFTSREAYTIPLYRIYLPIVMRN